MQNIQALSIVVSEKVLMYFQLQAYGRLDQLANLHSVTIHFVTSLHFRDSLA